MNTAEILEALHQLSVTDRLAIAETALRSLREEQQALTPDQLRHQMALAAGAALPDYEADSDLVAFTVLDGEEFHEYTPEELDQVDTHVQG